MLFTILFKECERNLLDSLERWLIQMRQHLNRVVGNIIFKGRFYVFLCYTNGSDHELNRPQDERLIKFFKLQPSMFLAYKAYWRPSLAEHAVFLLATHLFLVLCFCLTVTQKNVVNVFQPCMRKSLLGPVCVT